MKYISEERLIEEIELYDIDIHVIDVLNRLIDECKELNQWQPIETAPKDRRILILYEDDDVRVDWWHHESQQDNKIVAWTEIPEIPK